MKWNSILKMKLKSKISENKGIHSLWLKQVDKNIGTPWKKISNLVLYVEDSFIVTVLKNCLLSLPILAMTLELGTAASKVEWANISLFEERVPYYTHAKRTLLCAEDWGGIWLFAVLVLQPSKYIYGESFEMALVTLISKPSCLWEIA